MHEAIQKDLQDMNYNELKENLSFLFLKAEMQIFELENTTAKLETQPKTEESYTYFPHQQDSE